MGLVMIFGELGFMVGTGGVWPAERVDEDWIMIVWGMNVVAEFVADGVIVSGATLVKVAG